MIIRMGITSPGKIIWKNVELAPGGIVISLVLFRWQKGCGDFTVEDGEYFRMLTQSECQ